MEISQLALNIATIEGIIIGCILLYRILRIFPTYVKTGKVGNMDHMAMGDGLKLKWLLTETHPLPIAMDGLMMGFLIFVTMIFSSLLPYVFAVAIISYGIYRLAIYMRKQHVRKEEFIDALKGDHQ